MFKKFEEVEKKFTELGALLTDEKMLSDTKRYTAMMKEYSSLQELVETYRQYKKIVADFDSTKLILDTEKDPELSEMAKADLPGLEKSKLELESKLKILLLPKDP